MWFSKGLHISVGEMGNGILIPYTIDRETLVGIEQDIFFMFRYIIGFDRKGRGKLFVSIAWFYDSLIVCMAFDCRKHGYFGKWCLYCNEFNPFCVSRINSSVHLNLSVFYAYFDYVCELLCCSAIVYLDCLNYSYNFLLEVIKLGDFAMSLLAYLWGVWVGFLSLIICSGLISSIICSGLFTIVFNILSVLVSWPKGGPGSYDVRCP